MESPRAKNRYAAFMPMLEEATRTRVLSYVSAGFVVGIGLLCMTQSSSPAFYIGCFLPLGGLFLIRDRANHFFRPLHVKTWDVVMGLVLAALACVVVTGVILNAARQPTFVEGFSIEKFYEGPFAALGLQAASIVFFYSFSRCMPRVVALFLSAFMMSVYQTVLVGWDTPQLLLVFMPLEWIFLYGYVKTRSIVAVMTGRIAFALSVMSMQGLAYLVR